MIVPRRRHWSKRVWLAGFVACTAVLSWITSGHLPAVRRLDVAPLSPGEYRVSRVISGDTLELTSLTGEETFQVRLLSTQAASEASDGAELAAAALAFTRVFVARGNVTVSLDQHRLDRSGRYLVYLAREGEDLSTALIGRGLARFVPFPGNSPSRDRGLADAQQAAQIKQQGVWRARAASASRASIASE